jgi:biopolymer transport protein ExbB/TolQ
MAKRKSETPSIETQNEAMMFANKVKKAGQSKEQTKLIAAGIQKGIAEYKKSMKEKQRQADKAKKKQQKRESNQIKEQVEPTQKRSKFNMSFFLLIVSWCGFLGYYFISH